MTVGVLPVWPVGKTSRVVHKGRNALFVQRGHGFAARYDAVLRTVYFSARARPMLFNWDRWCSS